MPRSARSPNRAVRTQAEPLRSPAPPSRPRRRRPGGSEPCWLVYMLRCRDGSLYTGITNDIDRRLAAHAAGKASRYTRSRLPVTLVYRESQRTKSQALKREAAIKTLPRGHKEMLVGRFAGSASPRRPGPPLPGLDRLRKRE